MPIIKFKDVKPNQLFLLKDADRKNHYSTWKKSEHFNTAVAVRGDDVGSFYFDDCDRVLVVDDDLELDQYGIEFLESEIKRNYYVIQDSKSIIRDFQKIIDKPRGYSAKKIEALTRAIKSKKALIESLKIDGLELELELIGRA